jgi:hypothetical protein
LEVTWSILACFDGVGVRGVGEASKWCKDLEEFYECVSDSITELFLVCIMAGEDVVTIGVKDFATGSYI